MSTEAAAAETMAAGESSEFLFIEQNSICYSFLKREVLLIIIIAVQVLHQLCYVIIAFCRDFSSYNITGFPYGCQRFIVILRILDLKG